MNFEVAVSLLKNQTLVYLKQSHKVMTEVFHGLHLAISFAIFLYQIEFYCISETGFHCEVFCSMTMFKHICIQVPYISKLVSCLLTILFSCVT